MAPVPVAAACTRHDLRHPLPVEHLASALLHELEYEMGLHFQFHRSAFPGRWRGHHKAPAKRRHDEFSTMIEFSTKESVLLAC